ncbi:DUF3105 domain-containing protein [Nocardia sp. NPDC058633]|uniref:DUF3105 domain-containing protein n=1 Tax=Nocardia sp. NPDC058633 TaxID=3346568 RepID=UPI0036484AEB
MKRGSAMRVSDNSGGVRRAGACAVAVVAATLAGCSADTIVGKATATADSFAPSADNRDPSLQIRGVVVTEIAPGQPHVLPTQRVAYPSIPPVGGPHDAQWAACTGVVYPKALRTENAVHSMEHGAVWIAYDPAKVSAQDQATLRAKVTDRQYTLMSPIPDMDHPIMVQSWGHQLALDTASDERIDQFVVALRENPYTTPEVGATCSSPLFDRTDPPPYDPTPPGPDAVPMSGTR